MLFPLVVLSVLSVVGGIIQLPSFGIIPKGLRHRLEDWLHPVVAPGEAVISGTSAYDAKVWLALLAIGCPVAGIALGVLVYGRRKLRASSRNLADGWRYDRGVLPSWWTRPQDV